MLTTFKMTVDHYDNESVVLLELVTVSSWFSINIGLFRIKNLSKKGLILKKKKNYFSLDNWRPVTLLSCSSKVLESIITTNNCECTQRM